MKNLSFENLLRDAENLMLNENDSYLQSYNEFINYFDNIDIIEKHNLIIGSHFVYRWMPTIIHLDIKEIEKVVDYLNKAKSGSLLTENQLDIIKKCINNSIVGTSKLLHFINPEVYAIWDSRIFRYLTGKKSSYGIDKSKAYVNYLNALTEIQKHNDYQILHNKVQKNFKYEISSMRAIELLMFETDRQRNSNK